MLIFCQVFLSIFWDNCKIFILILWVWFITLIDFGMLNHFCIPGINPIWLWSMIFLMHHWITLSVVKDFCICFITVISLLFSLPTVSVLLLHQWLLPQTRIMKIFSSSTFSEECESLTTILYFVAMSQGSHLILGNPFGRSFLLMS